MGVSRHLGDLLGAIDASADTASERIRVSSLTDDSRTVTAGALFVAVPGVERDARAYIGDAVRAGAVAVVTEAPAPETSVPVVIVRDARRALAQLAADWHGRPADDLWLVGITGTVGKTSVLMMMGAILREAGLAAGTIGSLGAHWAGQVADTGQTTPDPLTLHRTLEGMRASGVAAVAMEVTSHSLVQRRVEGLTFDLGLFTNLMLLEHMEYHRSFADYVAAKVRFFAHLRRNAPVIYAAGDRAVDALVRSRTLRGIGVGSARDADVSLERNKQTAGGTALGIRVAVPLPLRSGGTLRPTELDLRLQLLGRPNLTNAALAAVAALCLGASVENVITALEAIRPPRRRMEMIRARAPMVIDDTVGHPDSITAVFEVARSQPHDALHVVFAIRGGRGPLINERDAEALLIWAEHVPIETLVITRCEDSADERNRVTDEERARFTGRLEAAGYPYAEEATLEAAIGRVLDAAGEDDLVLLLGAQGMDAGAEMVRERVG